MVVYQVISLDRRPTEMELLWIGEVLLQKHPEYYQGGSSYPTEKTYHNRVDGERVRITSLSDSIEVSAPYGILSELTNTDVVEKIKAGKRPIPVKRVDAFGIVDLFVYYYEIHPRDLSFYESIDEPGAVVAEAKNGKKVTYNNNTGKIEIADLIEGEETVEEGILDKVVKPHGRLTSQFYRSKQAINLPLDKAIAIYKKVFPTATGIDSHTNERMEGEIIFIYGSKSEENIRYYPATGLFEIQGKTNAESLAQELSNHLTEVLSTASPDRTIASEELVLNLQRRPMSDDVLFIKRGYFGWIWNAEIRTDHKGYDIRNNYNTAQVVSVIIDTINQRLVLSGDSEQLAALRRDAHMIEEELLVFSGNAFEDAIAFDFGNREIDKNGVLDRLRARFPGSQAQWVFGKNMIVLVGERAQLGDEIRRTRTHLVEEISTNKHVNSERELATQAIAAAETAITVAKKENKDIATAQKKLDEATRASAYLDKIRLANEALRLAEVAPIKERPPPPKPEIIKLDLQRPARVADVYYLWGHRFKELRGPAKVDGENRFELRKPYGISDPLVVIELKNNELIISGDRENIRKIKGKEGELLKELTEFHALATVVQLPEEIVNVKRMVTDAFPSFTCKTESKGTEVYGVTFADRTNDERRISVRITPEKDKNKVTIEAQGFEQKTGKKKRANGQISEDDATELEKLKATIEACINKTYDPTETVTVLLTRERLDESALEIISELYLPNFNSYLWAQNWRGQGRIKNYYRYSGGQFSIIESKEGVFIEGSRNVLAPLLDHLAEARKLIEPWIQAIPASERETLPKPTEIAKGEPESKKEVEHKLVIPIESSDHWLDDINGFKETFLSNFKPYKEGHTTTYRRGSVWVRFGFETLSTRQLGLHIETNSEHFKRYVEKKQATFLLNREELHAAYTAKNADLISEIKTRIAPNVFSPPEEVKLPDKFNVGFGSAVREQNKALERHRRPKRQRT